MITVNRANEFSASITVFGWYAGLGYYGLWSATAPHVPWWAHFLLGTVGMCVAAVVIGGGLATLAGLLTFLVTRKSDSSPIAFLLAGYVSPVVTFIAAGRALRWLAYPS